MEKSNKERFLNGEPWYTKRRISDEVSFKMRESLVGNEFGIITRANEYSSIYRFYGIIKRINDKYFWVEIMLLNDSYNFKTVKIKFDDLIFKEAKPESNGKEDK